MELSRVPVLVVDCDVKGVLISGEHGHIEIVLVDFGLLIGVWCIHQCHLFLYTYCSYLY